MGVTSTPSLFLSHTGTICLPSRDWDGILLGKHKHNLHYTKIITLIEGIGGSGRGFTLIVTNFGSVTRRLWGQLLPAAG